MEGSGVEIKAEPGISHFDDVYRPALDGFHRTSYPSSGFALSVSETVTNPDPSSLKLSNNDRHRTDIGPSCLEHGTGNLTRSNNMEFFPSESLSQSASDTTLDALHGMSCNSAPQSVSTLGIGANAVSYTHVFGSGKDSYTELQDYPEMSKLKPSELPTVKLSEALFVRALIGRCKRIAPLWFRGVSSMRERNREENRRMASNSGQTQSDWSLIGLKIAEMNAASETDAVANLLKKLYKELPADSVFWFLKCWLCSEDSVQDPDLCVISRGDAKGRMRRIDGGKGSDKVWRLDTIVGMLYHGLPMSSTDTNIMVHTCDQELCVRPQHIRFRASSVALVVVLKALEQAGYTVIPPPIPAGSDGVAPNASDESVDVFGPFTIDELQQYRRENLTPAEESISKLSLSAADREFAETVPVLRTVLQSHRVGDAGGEPPIGSNPLVNGYHSFPTTFDGELGHSHTVMNKRETFSADASSNNLNLPHRSSFTDGLVYRATKPNLRESSDIKPSIFPLCRSSSPGRGSTTSTTGFRPERRSLKRPAPTDSPCSFPSSPIRPTSHTAPSSSSPPLLMPDSTPHHTSQLRLLPNPYLHRDSRLSNTQQQPQTCLHPARDNSLSSSTSSLCSTNLNPMRSTTLHGLTCEPPGDLSTATTNATSGFVDSALLQPQHEAHRSTTLHSAAPSSPGNIIHQPYAMHQSFHAQLLHNQSTTGIATCGGVYVPNGHSMSLNTNPSSNSGSNSGKNTPRQPAKKRLEARTPTIEGDDSAAPVTTTTAVSLSGNGNTPNMDDSSLGVLSSGGCGNVPGAGLGTSVFRVHQNTPFVPVQSRSGRPSSSGSSSSASGFLSTNTGINSSATTRKLSCFEPIDNDLGGLSSSNRSGSGPSAPSITANQSDDEEEELRDIMVGRPGASILNTPAAEGNVPNNTHSNELSNGDNSGTHRPSNGTTAGTMAGTFPQLGRSPTHDRRMIEMIGRLLANAHGSPALGNSTPFNTRRSASACSHPRIGASPNENAPDIQLSAYPHMFPNPINGHGSSVANNSVHLFPHRSFSGHSLLSKTSQFSTAHSSEPQDRKSILPNGGGGSTPPPSLSLSTRDSGAVVDGSESTHATTNPPHLSALQPLNLNTDLSGSGRESVHEIARWIRDSPASGITPELIDVLYNMAQQYGMYSSRSESRTSRSPSQVAQNFYRSLVNGSMCRSPLLCNGPNQSSAFGPLAMPGSGSGSINGSSSDPISSSTFIGNGYKGPGCSLLSPTSCCSLTGAPTAHNTHPVHQLRGISFTPLPVNPEPSSSSAPATAGSHLNSDWHSRSSHSPTAPNLSPSPLSRISRHVSANATTTTSTTVDAADYPIDSVVHEFRSQSHPVKR